MKYFVTLLCALTIAHADTLPPGLVKSKTFDGSGNPISSTSGSLNVNITGGGGPSTVTANQGTAGGSPWPVTVSNFPGTQPVSGSLGRNWSLLNTTDSVNAVQSGTWNLGRTWTLNSGTDSVTIAGSITATNPSVSANGAAIPVQSTLVGGSDGTNLRPLKASAAGVLSVDGSAVTQPISAASLPLPSGASTSALQTSGNASLTSIDSKQTTANTSLSSIDSKLTSPLSVSQSGTWNLNNITGTVTLPTGAATAANQATVIANQTNGNQKVMVTAVPSDVVPGTQSITVLDASSVTTAQANGQNAVTGAPTAGSAATFSITSEQAIEVQVTGTWTGTLQSEVSMDGGTTWYTRGLKQTGSPYIASSFTQNFAGGLNASGMTNYRVRATAAMTGSATVRVVSSVNTGSVTITNPLTLRDATTQTISGTIKAASTAALATDTSLVVAVSPNSPASVNSFLDKSGSGSLTGLGQTVGGVSNGMSTCNFTVTGTWSGVLFISGAVNGGVPISLPAFTANGNPVGLTFFPSTNGTYGVNCAGFDHVFIQFFSFVSGTANITYNFGSGVNYVNTVLASNATNGSAVPSRSQLISGSDGTNAHNLSVDTNGVLQTSLGNNSGKVTKMLTASLATATTTANQIVVTYTVTGGKTFYLQYFDMSVILNSTAATQTIFGTMSLVINGATVYTSTLKGAGSSYLNPIYFAEPIPVPAGQVVLMEVTPATVATFLWNGDFGGYEK